MAITAITKLAVADFVPDREIGADLPATFRLRPLTGPQYLEMISEMVRDSEGQTRLSGRGLRRVIEWGLVGWSNILDENGQPFKFSQQNVALIPPLVLSEIASEIINRSEIGEEQEKN